MAVQEEPGVWKFAVNFTMGNNLFNLYGLLAPPARRENLERLIKPEVYVDVGAQYSKNPFKTACKLNQVSSRPIYNQQPSRAIAYG